MGRLLSSAKIISSNLPLGKQFSCFEIEQVIQVLIIMQVVSNLVAMETEVRNK